MNATDELRGATSTEYALLITLVAIVIIIAVTLFGNQLLAMFSNAASSV